MANQKLIQAIFELEDQLPEFSKRLAKLYKTDKWTWNGLSDCSMSIPSAKEIEEALNDFLALFRKAIDSGEVVNYYNISSGGLFLKLKDGELSVGFICDIEAYI